MKSTFKLWLGLCGVLASTAVSASAADKPAGIPDSVMAQAMKMGQPGDSHQILALLVGKWDCMTRAWMQPGAPPQESRGSAENTLIMGGRFVKQSLKGEWAGQSYEGLGYMGYDNLKAEFENVWFDNMSTGMMQSAGSYDALKKTINLAGTFSCPITGEKNRWERSEVRFVDSDTIVYASYMKAPDGKEFQAMEITYKRTK